jgi:hypothetical protein
VQRPLLRLLRPYWFAQRVLQRTLIEGLRLGDARAVERAGKMDDAVKRAQARMDRRLDQALARLDRLERLERAERRPVTTLSVDVPAEMAVKIAAETEVGT